VTASTSVVVTGLPTDGRTLNVRLWSLVNGGWQYNDYTYTAFTSSPAAITNPANGSTLNSSAVTFQWTAGTATQYGLWVGSTGVGSSNLATPPATANTSVVVAGLPTDGRTLNVRLWSLVNGSWQFNDYTYTASTSGSATMISPVNGTTFVSSTVAFQWTSGVATQYGLWVGNKGVGSSNLATPSASANTSVVIAGLPTDGSTLNVRLWSLVNGGWQYNDYTYTASTFDSATMINPVNGTTFGSSTVTFQWTAGAATQYGLWIGSTGVGSSDLGGSPGGAATSYTATGLPTDSRTIYVRLWSLVSGIWHFNDYTYTAL
jgi:hypothetical protein